MEVMGFICILRILSLYRKSLFYPHRASFQVVPTKCLAFSVCVRQRVRRRCLDFPGTRSVYPCSTMDVWYPVLAMVVRLCGSLNITVTVHGVMLSFQYSSCVCVHTVSYRIVCVRVRVRVRMAPRFARRTGAGGMLYVDNTTLFR